MEGDQKFNAITEWMEPASQIFHWFRSVEEGLRRNASQAED